MDGKDNVQDKQIEYPHTIVRNIQKRYAAYHCFLLFGNTILVFRVLVETPDMENSSISDLCLTGTHAASLDCCMEAIASI
jgi:hypothetical protein